MAEKKKNEVQVVIGAPNIQAHTFHIRGTAPYVQCKFSQKARNQMKAAQEETTAQKNAKKKREPRDFDAMFIAAIHHLEGGGYGIPAPAFRNAMISACRVAGVVMTKAKLSVFVLPDGVDEDDGTPLVRIIGDEPERHESHVRINNGRDVDFRIRPMWRRWEAKVRVQWDADQMSPESVANLLMRAGMQVGIGDGRHDSKSSCGQGWGTFEVIG